MKVAFVCSAALVLGCALLVIAEDNFEPVPQRIRQVSYTVPAGTYALADAEAFDGKPKPAEPQPTPADPAAPGPCSCNGQCRCGQPGPEPQLSRRAMKKQRKRSRKAMKCHGHAIRA